MKNLKKIILIIFCFVLLSSCSTKKPYVSPELSNKETSQWEMMCGNWYGKSYLENHEKREWLIERTNDGRYSIIFITTKQNGFREKIIEKGEWGVSGNIYFSIFKSQIYNNEETAADPTDPANRDAYKIIKLTNRIFIYKHLRTHLKYEVEKVDDNFQLN